MVSRRETIKGFALDCNPKSYHGQTKDAIFGSLEKEDLKGCTWLR